MFFVRNTTGTVKIHKIMSCADNRPKTYLKGRGTGLASCIIWCPRCSNPQKMIIYLGREEGGGGGVTVVRISRLPRTRSNDCYQDTITDKCLI